MKNKPKDHKEEEKDSFDASDYEDDDESYKEDDNFEDYE